VVSQIYKNKNQKTEIQQFFATLLTNLI